MHLVLQAKQGVSEGGASAVLDSVPPLHISIRGKERHMKIDKVICMPVQEYDELWAVSCRMHFNNSVSWQSQGHASGPFPRLY